MEYLCSNIFNQLKKIKRSYLKQNKTKKVPGSIIVTKEVVRLVRIRYKLITTSIIV